MVSGKRRSGQAQLQRDAELLPLIESLKMEHPFWGYRRVWATLRYKNGLIINVKRVARLMRLHGLGVKRAALRAKRTPSGSKPRPVRPCQWWGIDMTKVMTEGGWVYIVLVVDWFSKKIVGHHADYRSRSHEWLQALDTAIQTHFPGGVRGHGLSLMSDNGCQPTGTAFMRDCATLGITQAFTSYNNPKGNADTERTMRTIKEELFWLHEWRSLEHLDRALSDWIENFNTTYLHSALGWKTPQGVHQQANKTWRNSPLKAA
ncbi:IS3 family transposase [Nitratidesulfovibrio termitidis]|uniref:IS3 family transposase n=1 Tax=Nitratidesulfovibrio termitidis TaxID=42252 RepID=UPI00068603E8|nr:IS3 family transposase [Nitratidesulfovibrio termitidis]